jgi:hypothetical protein
VIEENATALLRTVRKYAPTDKRYALFAALFIDSYDRNVYRQFVMFNAAVDNAMPLFDNSRRPNDEDKEPMEIPLQCILHCINMQFNENNERILDWEKLVQLLRMKAVEMSFVTERVVTVRAVAPIKTIKPAFDNYVAEPPDSTDEEDVETPASPLKQETSDFATTTTSEGGFERFLVRAEFNVEMCTLLSDFVRGEQQRNVIKDV